MRLLRELKFDLRVRARLATQTRSSARPTGDHRGLEDVRSCFGAHVLGEQYVELDDCEVQSVVN